MQEGASLELGGGGSGRSGLLSRCLGSSRWQRLPTKGQEPEGRRSTKPRTRFYEASCEEGRSGSHLEAAQRLAQKRLCSFQEDLERTSCRKDTAAQPKWSALRVPGCAVGVECRCCTCLDRELRAPSLVFLYFCHRKMGVMMGPLSPGRCQENSKENTCGAQHTGPGAWGAPPMLIIVMTIIILRRNLGQLPFS